LLPISKELSTAEVITSPHNVSFNHICKQFKINYFHVSKYIDFKNALKDAHSSNSPTFIELSIDDNKNIELYSKLRTIND